MKIHRGLVVERRAHEQILVLLRRDIGHMIEIPCIRNSGRIHAVVHGGANLRVPARLPAHVGRRGGYVVLVIGQRIAGLHPTEGAQVVDLVVRACHLQLLTRRIEAARIALEHD